MHPAWHHFNGKTPFCQPPYAIRAFNILGEPCQFASRSTQERTDPAGRRGSSHSAGTRAYRRRKSPMRPYHRSRPVPPPASRRSGLGSREVSPEKWNLLRDEEARLCALNPWWEVRWHDMSVDAAGEDCQRLPADPVPRANAPWGGAARSELPTAPAAAPSGMVPRAEAGDPRHSFSPPSPCNAPGARQDCDRSAGRGPPNLRSDSRAEPEISQEKQEFPASGPLGTPDVVIAYIDLHSWPTLGRLIPCDTNAHCQPGPRYFSCQGFLRAADP